MRAPTGLCSNPLLLAAVHANRAAACGSQVLPSMHACMLLLGQPCSLTLCWGSLRTCSSVQGRRPACSKPHQFCSCAGRLCKPRLSPVCYQILHYRYQYSNTTNILIGNEITNIIVLANAQVAIMPCVAMQPSGAISSFSVMSCIEYCKANFEDASLNGFAQRTGIYQARGY